MKRYCIEAVLALSVMLGAQSAKAATALIYASGTEEQAAAAQADWKNEKQLLDRLATVSPAEISTTAIAGQHALIIGLCDKSDADSLMPVLTTLYPSLTSKEVEGKGTTCPKFTSTAPTKVVAKHIDKQPTSTLIVALFEGLWNKGETIQVAVAAVRDKDGDIVDNFSQRAGTILGGETCKADLASQGKVAVLSRRCEGTSDVETIKLSLLKGRLKQE